MARTQGQRGGTASGASPLELPCPHGEGGSLGHLHMLAGGGAGQTTPAGTSHRDHGLQRAPSARRGLCVDGRQYAAALQGARRFMESRNGKWIELVYLE